MEQLLDSVMDVFRAVDDGSSYDDMHGEHVPYDARSDDAPFQHQNQTDLAGLSLTRGHGDRPAVFKEDCVERRLCSDREQRESQAFVGRLCATKDRLRVTRWLSDGIKRCHGGACAAVNKPRVLRRAFVGATAPGLETRKLIRHGRCVK